MNRSRRALALILLLAACEQPPQQPAAPLAGGVVDSIFPIEEEIRRFKATLSGPPPTALTGGAPSRDRLAAMFIKALESSDTAGLRRMVVTPWEFIELYYPYTQYTRAPYKQSPQTFWFLIQQNSDKGFSRALSRFGGKPTGYRGLDCPPVPLQQGDNRLWERCVVRWTATEGKPDPLGLFGSILERNGQFKFLSYSNDL